MAGDLRLGKRALQGSPGLLDLLRAKGAGTAAAQFRMGVKLRHPERYDESGHLKDGAAADDAKMHDEEKGQAEAMQPKTAAKRTVKAGAK